MRSLTFLPVIAVAAGCATTPNPTASAPKPPTVFTKQGEKAFVIMLGELGLSDRFFAEARSSFYGCGITHTSQVQFPAQDALGFFAACDKFTPPSDATLPFTAKDYATLARQFEDMLNKTGLQHIVFTVVLRRERSSSTWTAAITSIAFMDKPRQQVTHAAYSLGGQDQMPLIELFSFVISEWGDDNVLKDGERSPIFVPMPESGHEIM